MTVRIHRRHFLGTVAAGTAGLMVLRESRSSWSYQANQKLNVALVGVGGRGTWFVDTIPRMERVVALCDVNQKKIDDTFQYWTRVGARYAASPHSWERSAGVEFQRLVQQRPRTFPDFRHMLENMGQGIDVVVVATPDHTHAIVSAAAIRAGKAVFCEKPLTRTVHEARALRELARRYKVPTAMGNQGTYSGPFRRALELIRNGNLGDIKEVHIWNSAGGADRKDRPKGTEPVPEGLQWDLWLGPAAARPFHHEWMQRNLWRELGTCQLGNWASHTANLGFMALKVHELWLGATAREKLSRIRVTARCPAINMLSFPRWEIVDWDIPPRAGFGPITFRWYNSPAPGLAELLAPLLKDAPAREKGLWNFAGTLIVGSKGTIHTSGHNMWFRLLPGDKFQGVQRERPETVENSRGPEQDLFQAVRGGKAPWSNFDYASALNEFLMLGNVATQFNDTIEFDPMAMKIVNNTKADALLRCDYRPGWSL
jgi:hypothetical protein